MGKSNLHARGNEDYVSHKCEMAQPEKQWQHHGGEFPEASIRNIGERFDWISKQKGVYFHVQFMDHKQFGFDGRSHSASFHQRHFAVI